MRVYERKRERERDEAVRKKNEWKSCLESQEKGARKEKLEIMNGPLYNAQIHSSIQFETFSFLILSFTPFHIQICHIFQ